ncbi:MAG: CDP-alcohol phosphatidyltransferase family protein [Propionibacteriaceae bacterium]|jgi:cardiolipin synthase|nr:CDP-alcohol phosphatidyltransferase family protein [Propionibacteriaceae bacterium]
MAEGEQGIIRRNLNRMTGEEYDTDAVLTVPNVLSIIRICGIPLFLWLLLGPHWDIAAVCVLAASSFTDFLDGKIARRFHQRSRLGQVLDPTADRLYTWTVVLGMCIRGIVPVWLVVLLAARDLSMGVTIWPALRRRGFASLPVHLMGKTATFLLLLAFPVVLLGSGPEAWQYPVAVFGWALVVWGTLLYWWSAFLYLGQGVQVIRAFPKLKA